LVLEEIGYSLAPSPFLASVAIAAQAIVESGNAALSERLLPGIASGERIATLAWAAPDGSWNPAFVAVTAAQTGNDWLLDGHAPYVLDGGSADIVLAIAQTPGGPALFAVSDAADVTREETPTLDQTMPLATLR